MAFDGGSKVNYIFSKGFSLIDMLIAIAVMAIILAIGLPLLLRRCLMATN
jgi:prepilin-type N-terminal cleavage/methylation domain-containing protein